jgi:hypothetical protein
MTVKGTVETTLKKKPIKVEVEIEYTATELIEVMKAYPDFISQVIKLTKKEKL